MKFAELLDITAQSPIFETGLLLAGDVDAPDIRRQLVRWTAAGKLHQLRRGLYSVARPWTSVTPHPFVVSNALVRGSYVSLQAALAFYGLIPEGIAVTTSVGPGAPRTRSTPWGMLDHRHLGVSYRLGYVRTAVTPDQDAYVARPEKALLDLVHLTPRGDTPAYLEALRLQHLDRLDLDGLVALADTLAKPKLQRAARHLVSLAEDESKGFDEL